MEISVNKYSSVALGIADHYDCAGNSVPKEKHIEQIWKKGIKLLKNKTVKGNFLFMCIRIP
ncbi:MAG: hypothetical protein K9M56_06480 [Victivallales bacterium]|nr:hypothetical protein [Victivallales bacterium]